MSRLGVGYKLHAIASGNPMPDAFAITPLNVCEKRMAARMIRRVRGCGYLVGDAYFDASCLFDYCHFHSHQLVCPRAKPGTGLGQRYISPHRSRLAHADRWRASRTGLGQRYISPHRRRAINMLETPAVVNPFGSRLFDRRTDIERNFSGMVCFGGGLTTLPPWVRRIWRVRAWPRAMRMIILPAAPWVRRIWRVRAWVTAKLLINAARIRLIQREAG